MRRLVLLIVTVCALALVSAPGAGGSDFTDGPLRMEVKGGTGIYAGLVDAVPGGAEQNFSPIAIPSHSLLTGLCKSIVVPVYKVSMRFELLAAAA